MEDRRKTQSLAQQPDDGKDHGLSRLTRRLRRLSEATSAAARGDTTWTSVLDMALGASTGLERPKYAVSCLMDSKPKFQEQTLIWISALRACDAQSSFEIFVHYISPQPAELLKQLERAGCHLVEVAPFGAGAAKYCNKLQQLQTFLGAEFDEVVLTDTDVVFVRSPQKLVGTDAVRAKIVDLPNPTQDVLAKLIARAGFGSVELSGRPDFAKCSPTHLYNCNGGCYVFPGRVLPEFSDLWLKWSRFCLEQEDLLGEKLIHADQLGFMFAMIEGGFEFDALPCTANFPTHFPANSYSKLPNRAIMALHYHDKLDHQGELLFTGNAAIDRSIQRANMQIRAGKKALELGTSLQPAA
jgi:hypothetical protein